MSRQRIPIVTVYSAISGCRLQYTDQNILEHITFSVIHLYTVEITQLEFALHLANAHAHHFCNHHLIFHSSRHFNLRTRPVHLVFY
jgi:hypothetical protein